MKKIVIIITLTSAVSGLCYSQTSITLKAAVDMALENNLLVKNEQLKAQYQQLMINTVTVIPKTGIIADAGQINSIYTDTKFGISQTFSLPKVYTRQKQLLQQEWKASLLNVAIKEALLKKQVSQVFYMLVYLKQKKELLQNLDSLYSAVYKKASLRLAAGETNVLEKASSEMQLGQIGIQLNQLRQDSAILQLQFQLLLNTTTAMVPQADEYTVNKSSLQSLVYSDTVLLKNHVSLKLVEHQQQIADAAIEVEKSRLLPDLSIGFNNTSIKGTGADNKLYSSGKRFSSVQASIGIPIFAKAQKQKINSAKFNRQIAGDNYALELQALQTAYMVAVAQYNKSLEAVKYYENHALKNAALITATAGKQLNNGDINYLEWVQLISQATTVKSDYTDAVKNLNESLIQLNYFTNQ